MTPLSLFLLKSMNVVWTDISRIGEKKYSAIDRAIRINI